MYNTGYASQVNQYLQPFIQKLDPQLQQQFQPLQPQKPSPQRFLDKLQEEAAEIVQAVSKIRRFGPENRHPDREQSNKQELVGELEDLLALVAVLEHLKYFDLSTSKDQIKQKAEALLK